MKYLRLVPQRQTLSPPFNVINANKLKQRQPEFQVHRNPFPQLEEVSSS